MVPPADSAAVAVEEGQCRRVTAGVMVCSGCDGGCGRKRAVQPSDCRHGDLQLVSNRGGGGADVSCRHYR